MQALAGIAFAQLVRPGAPVVLGSFASSISMQSGAPTFGTPEALLSTFAIGQLCRRLGLPLRCGGHLTASKTAGCTIPEPMISIQPVRLQAEQPDPSQMKQLTSTSAEGSVNGKYDGRNRVRVVGPKKRDTK